MGSGELTSATGGGLARLIAGREVSVREVVEAHLRRIGDVNGAINAVVQVDGERALIRAATVRCGASAEGLPIDVQLVARPWRDDMALAAALRLEQELGGWRPPTLAQARTPSPRPVP